MTTKRIAQLTLILAVIVAGYFFFVGVQGSGKVGVTFTNTTSSLNTGLVGHWTFDGPDVDSETRVVHDRSSYAVSTCDDDDYTNVSTSTVSGVMGQALYFDGTHQIECPPADVNHLDPGTGDFSVSLWARTTATVAQTVLWKDAADGWRVQTRPGGEVQFTIHDGTNTKSATVDGTTVNDGDWHLITVTFDRSGNGVRYVDGVQTGTQDDITNVSGDVGNGKSLIFSTYTNPYEGDLDDVRIYNRVLSAAEIRQLYAMGSNRVGKTKTPSGLETDLVAHWTFDGPDMITNVADVSGNARHGTISGQTSTTTTRGALGQALYFDGSDDYVDTINYDFPTGGWTLSVWVNIPDGFTGFGRFFSKYLNGSNQKWFMHIGGVIDFGADDGTDTNYISTGSTKYNDGQWHHAVVVVDDTNAILYVDGVQADSTGHDGSFLFNSVVWRLGAINGGGEYYTGAMDDARIYERALSVDEVQQLYNLGASNKVTQTVTPTGLKSSLVGHWTFDGKDMTTATATDASGNGNDGTLSGPVPTIGRIGQALEFDGSSDYVAVGTPTELNDLGPYTLSAWVYKTSNPANDDYVLGKRDGSCTGGWKWNLTSAGSIDWFKKGTTNVTRVSSANSLPNDGWFHLLTTWDGSTNFSGVHHYVNGVETSYTTESNGSALSSDATCDLNIGTSDSGFGLFEGALDDVRVYDRVLTVNEIEQLYNMGR